MDLVEAALFRDIPAAEARSILDRSRPRVFAKGEVVYHEGDPGETLHLIADGRFMVRVSASTGGSIALAVLDAGDMFGELALLGETEHRTGTVVALEPGRTMSIGRDALAWLRRIHPVINDVLLTQMARELDRCTQRFLEALYLPAGQRLFRRLLELRSTYGDDVPLRQEDLAALAGMSRVTANRLLREEHERGTVRLARSHIEILDAGPLEARAGGGSAREPRLAAGGLLSS